MARGGILKRVQDDIMILIFPDRRTKEHIFYFGLWPLAVSRLEDGELNSRGF